MPVIKRNWFIFGQMTIDWRGGEKRKENGWLKLLFQRRTLNQYKMLMLGFVICWGFFS